MCHDKTKVLASEEECCHIGEAVCSFKSMSSFVIYRPDGKEMKSERRSYDGGPVEGQMLCDKAGG